MSTVSGPPCGHRFPASKATAPVMAAAMRRANRNDLAKLKSILEHT